MMSEFGRGPGATMMDSVRGVICVVDVCARMVRVCVCVYVCVLAPWVEQGKQ